MSFVVPSLKTRGFLCFMAKKCLVRILGALGKMAGKGLRKIFK